ncbi:hypothetical protein AALO_G00116470 [Alosa alosa]|uniref:Uncharacterized protein n=1 Tax=Alosa alosa TaxID=278164 RepID=A0AAV6GR82_9TELE|nr:hypothetical protein AALO_G00116470 [Alosa alosa]
MAGVGVSVGLLAAVLMIIVVMRKRKSKAGGEPKLNSDEERSDLHYASFQPLNPTQATGTSATQSEDTVTYSTIMQLSGGEDQSNRPVDPNAVYATVHKNDKIKN